MCICQHVDTIHTKIQWYNSTTIDLDVPTTIGTPTFIPLMSNACKSEDTLHCIIYSNILKRVVGW